VDDPTPGPDRASGRGGSDLCNRTRFLVEVYEGLGSAVEAIEGIPAVGLDDGFDVIEDPVTEEGKGRFTQSVLW
jgi:hypothetical protein